MGDILRHALFAHMPILRDIVYGAARYGVDIHELCGKLGISPQDLNNSEKRAGFETSCLAWEFALKATGDPILGLHLGETSNPSILGLVGHLMQNSENLLDAYRQVSRYSRVATNMFDYKIEERKDQVILTYTPAAIWKKTYPDGARQATDQAMAGTLNVFHLLSGRRVAPLAVTVSSLARKSVREYERVLSTVSAGSADQLILQRGDLLTPILNSDRSLFRVFERAVQEKRESSTDTLKSRLQVLILAEFSGQVPPIQVLSARMNMTVRSLQRGLEAEGVNYRSLSEEIRRGIARKLLGSTDHKVAQVASILGYSGPRAFRRAYKSWTKQTPGSARKVGKRK